MNAPPTSNCFAMLAPQFLEKLANHKADERFKRKELVRFYKDKVPDVPIRDVYLWWTPLNQGEIVPFHVAYNFVGLVKDSWQWPDADPATACIVVPAPVAREPEERWYDWVEVGEQIKDHTRSKYSATEGMFIREVDRDVLVPKAAELVTYCVGYLHTQPGEPFGRKDCVDRGAHLMQISLTEYTEWIGRILDREPAAFMFAIGRGKENKPVRVAACAVLPLTESAMRRICSGEILDFDLTPDDIESPSPYIYLHAGGIDHEMLHLTGEKAAVAAQMHCFMYQEAWLTRDAKPHVIAAPTNQLYIERLAAAGYRRLGVKNRMAFELTVLDGGSPDTQAAYKNYSDVIRRYQEENGWAAKNE